MTTSTQSVLPDLESLNGWRRCAITTWFRPDLLDCPEGWSLSKADPAEVLSCFPGLKLRDGMALRGYEFKEWNNANGLVLPLPPETPPEQFLPDPPALAKTAGVAEVMSAISGDVTPQSYLAASLFYRELREFGALGHGINWLDYHLLNNSSWTGEHASHADEPLALHKEEWDWLEAVDNFDPAVNSAGSAVSVSFYTFHGRENELIERHVDRFVDGYRFQSATSKVATFRNR
jgi:hypothetical protein